MKRSDGSITLCDLNLSSRLFDIADGFEDAQQAILFLGHATTTKDNYSDFMKHGAQICFDLLNDRMSELSKNLRSIQKEVTNLEEHTQTH